MISVYEMRRRAPLHFEARADNDRFTAYILWNAHRAEGASVHAGAIGYNGNQAIAGYEGFRREASIALELILKAVIAQRLEVGEDLGRITKVPAHHNVPQLWNSAKLPKLTNDDFGRLVMARVSLMWAGRYPAPNRDEDGDRDDEDLWRHAYKIIPTSSMFREPVSFDWEGVNRIYSIAQNCFWDVRRAGSL